MKNTPIILAILLFFSLNIYSQTAIQTSFESSEGYSQSTITGINKWSGHGVITTTPDYIKTGQQSLRLSSSASSLQTDHIAYDKNSTGLTNDVYLDLWLNVQALNGEFTITTYDLTPNSSSKRGMMIALTSGKQVKIFSGSSGSNEKAYTLGEWIRLSAKIDYATGTYEVAVNGSVIDKKYNFRESYTPASLGRPNGEMEYHSLRFSNSTATNDIAVDDLYISTSPIPDVTFGAPDTKRTINIIQPENGIITLTPQKETYEAGETITARIAANSHYLFTGWTGDLDGNENPKTFTITRNMSIGATVTIDPANPPASYTLTINQPAEGGEILVEPVLATYYEGTNIKLTATANIGYEFRGWTGDLNGEINPMTFSIEKNMTISANMLEKTDTGTQKEVATVNELKTALNNMIPGDEIVVADGDYPLGGITLRTLGGTISKPVVIRAKNIGKASFTGKTNFTLNACENIIFQGFKFDVEHVSSIFKLEGSSYIRITQNEFRMTATASQSSKWILIGEVWENEYCRSKYNRVDHNLFEGKYDSGAWLVIDGSHGSVPEISKYDRIDHNHFRLCQPRVANEKETVRVGVSDLSMKSAHCTVEYNLFEECDGDPEIVSIKSCDNIIRGNTFRKSLGTLSLRHGFRNRVEGNYFFGEEKTDADGNGCGGVRVYGLDHVVVNNYFEGLTGSKWDAAITLTNGDTSNSSSSLTSHFLPENVTIAFNTLVNNESNIEIGFDNNGKYGRAPKNCLIAHNIVVENKNPIIKSYSTASLAGVKFENNLMYPTGTSSVGITYNANQVKEQDPKLIRTNNRTPESTAYSTPFETYKLSAGSPARDAATGSYSYLSLDSEGQNRIGVFDIGADEYNDSDPILYGALDSRQIGIYGTLDGYESPGTSMEIKSSENDITLHCNPLSGALTINTSRQIKQVTITSSSGSIHLSDHKQTIYTNNLLPGIYLICITFEEGNSHTGKFIKR